MSSSKPDARISLRSQLRSIELSVFDARFNEVASGVGELSVDVPSGLYEVEFRAGPEVESKLIALSPGEVYEDQSIWVGFPSAAPLPGTSTSHEYHQEAARQTSHRALTAPQPSSSGLMVMVRNLRGQDDASVDNHTTGTLSVFNSEMQRVDVPTSWEINSGQKYAVWTASLPPGGYFLRVQRTETADLPVTDVFDQSIWLNDGWRTHVFIPNGPIGPVPESASIHLIELDMEWEPYDEEVGLALELALWGLRQGRSVLPADLVDALLRSKFRNPMLGIIGGHALLLASDVDFGLFETVWANLNKLVPFHPDVMALAWIAQESRSLRGELDHLSSPLAEPAEWPPMLAASYAALIRLDAALPGAIREGSLAEAAAPESIAQGVWTSWRPLEHFQERGMWASSIPPTERTLQETHLVRQAEAEGGVRQEALAPAGRESGQVIHDVVSSSIRRLAQAGGALITSPGWVGWSTGSIEVDPSSGSAAQKVSGYLEQVAKVNDLRRVDRLVATEQEQVATATGLPSSLVRQSLQAVELARSDQLRVGTHWLLLWSLVSAILTGVLITTGFLTGLSIAGVATALVAGLLGSLSRSLPAILSSRRKGELVEARLARLALIAQALSGCAGGLLVASLAWNGFLPMPGRGTAFWVSLAIYAFAGGLVAPAFAGGAPATKRQFDSGTGPGGSSAPEQARGGIMASSTSKGRGESSTQTSQKQGGSETPVLSWKSPALWVAMGVIALFIWLVIWTVGKRADANWDHIVYVFASVEALAFAAAGAIFGTQVQRQQTEKAQEQADEERTRAETAQDEAKRNATRAARGESLAAAVKSAARGGGGAEGREAEARGGLNAPAEAPVLQHLAAIADGVLPEA